MTQLATQPVIPVADAPKGKAAALTVADESQFANLLDTGRFEHMWRVGTMFSKSSLIPEHFRGKPEDCFIATQMAVRLGVDPFMFMQNTYVVHGRPGMEAKLAIALMNSGGSFANGIEYEVEGDDASNPDYMVRAFAVKKATGKTLFGPWITWNMVRKEGWDKKPGSKWQTIPSQMFHYRAAVFFGRLYCPERLMGMQTADELEDTTLEQVVVIPAQPKGAAALLGKLKAADPEPAPQPATTPQDEPAAQTPVDPPRQQEAIPEPPMPTATPKNKVPDKDAEALFKRWSTPTLYPRNKGEKPEAYTERFRLWVMATSEIDSPDLTMEQVVRCNDALAELEENQP